MFAKQAIVFGAFALLSAPSFAHSIFLNCSTANEQIECKGSFSDGSAASDFPFEVISYEDELLVKGQTDKDSAFSFPTPDQDYYILLDAGPGHVIELDILDVQ